MDEVQKIADALVGVIKLMVDNPQAVSAFVTGNPADGFIVKFFSDKADAGKIIGKQGRMAKALRLLVIAMGMTSKSKITLDING
jgi:uncharacterized protein